MTLSILFGIVAIGLLMTILWRVWNMVRFPLPLEMQEALERKEEAKIEVLKKEWSTRLAEEVMRISQQVQGQVSVTEQSVGQKLQQANESIEKVAGELGRLQEATRKVEEVGRNVASLQDLLRAPKMRGGLGEFFLAELLAQIFPPGGEFFKLQYGFSDGERVDAVICLQDRLVPVDSKFPLENFQKMGQAVTNEERNAWRKVFVRDVKLHIDAIAQKYIRPAERTFDFALMYIPAENVYYETIIKEDGVADEKGIFQHALEKKVIPVSPNSFYAYLAVIVQGLNGFDVERHAQEILGSLMKLKSELAAVREDLNRAGKQMGNAVENFQKADKHLGKFQDRLENIVPSGAVESISGPEVVREVEQSHDR